MTSGLAKSNVSVALCDGLGDDDKESSESDWTMAKCQAQDTLFVHVPRNTTWNGYVICSV
jgi:hypothetical protein